MDIKIADFGLSSFVDSQKMVTACGTPAYVGTSSGTRSAVVF
jgi:serine/threonine protein kinase